MRFLCFKNKKKSPLYLGLRIFGKRQVISYCIFSYLLEKKKNKNFISKEIDYIYSNEGKNGDALLFDSTNCFHRASIPAENQTRKMLQLTLLVLPESLRCKRNYYHDSNQFMNYHNRYRKMCKPQTRYQTLKLLFNYFGFVKNY